MKSFIKIFFILFTFTFISSHIVSQDMTPPKPKKSETLDMLMGVWVAEPYQMFGATWTDEANHYMHHNDQYMFIEIKGKSDKGQTYTATIIINPSSDGSFTGHGFDDWGGVSTMTGTTKGNHISAMVKSMWGSESRDIEITGDKAVHKLVWTMKGSDGKDQVTNMTLTYNKKK